MHARFVLSLVALTLFAGCQTPETPACAVDLSGLELLRSETPPSSITVTGFGNVPAAPDMATIHIGTQTHDADAAAAIAGSNAKVERITAALHGLGVAAVDVQVTSVAMTGAPGSTPACQTDDQCAMDEICDNGNCVFSGIGGRPRAPRGAEAAASIAVEQQLVVTLREPGKLGELLTQAVAAGSGNIQSVAFSIAEPDELNRQAREDAMADARARAEQLAAGLGAVLGPVMTIAESPGGFDQMSAYAGGGPARMYDQVTVTYRLR